MALVSIGLDFGDSGRFELFDRRSYVRKYVARSNNRFDNPLSVQRDRLCPRPGQQDPIDPGALFTSVEPTRRDGTSFVWDITATSSSEFEFDEDPLSKPARITPSSDQYVTTSTVDAEGRPIMTTARTLIPIEKEASRWVFNVEKNLPYLPSWLMGMNNKINSGVVFIKGVIVPRHTLMVKGLRGEEQEARVNGRRVAYMTVFFSLHYQREGYRQKVPNVDLVEIGEEALVVRRDRTGRIIRVNQHPDYDRVVSARRRIKDENGQDRTEPWPLDRQGRALPLDYTADQVLYLDVDAYEETSFDLLPLR